MANTQGIGLGFVIPETLFRKVRRHKEEIRNTKAEKQYV